MSLKTTLYKILDRIGYNKNKITEYIKNFEITVLSEIVSKDNNLEEIFKSAETEDLQNIQLFFEKSFDKKTAKKFLEDYNRTYANAILDLIEKIVKNIPEEEKEPFADILSELLEEFEKEGIKPDQASN